MFTRGFVRILILGLAILFSSPHLQASDFLLVGNLKEIKHLSVYPEPNTKSTGDYEIIETHVPHWHLYELTILKTIHGKLNKNKIVVAYEHWSFNGELNNRFIRISKIRDKGLAEYTNAQFVVNELIEQFSVLCISDDAFSLFPETQTWDEDEREPLFQEYGKKCYSEHYLVDE